MLFAIKKASIKFPMQFGIEVKGKKLEKKVFYRKRRVNAEETCSHLGRLSTVCLELHYESRVKAKVQLRFSYLCSVVKTIFLIF